MRWLPGPAALWFVRHGQSEGNVIRDRAEAQARERFEFATRDADVPLSDLGRDQAAAFGRWLADQPAERWPTAVITSPYLRTRQTAEILLAAAGSRFTALPVDVDERLRDREMGLWEGLTWRGIQARFPEQAEHARLTGRYYHRPAGGESWCDLLLRLRSVLDDVGRQWPAERVLVVSHDVTIQLCRALIEGLGEADVVSLITTHPYANCALSSFEARDGQYERTAYNHVTPVRAEGEPVTKEPDAAAQR